MPPRQRILSMLALVTAAAALAGCGSTDVPKTLSTAETSELNAQLDAIQSAISHGDCTTAEANAQDFVNRVNQLPATVGTDVKAPLQQAGENLKTLATDPSQCNPSGATGLSGAQSTSSSTTEAPPVTSTPEQTTTSTATTTTSTTKPAPQPSPPENGGGDQGGGPSGGGQGGGNTGGVGGGTGGTGGTTGGGFG
jgi:outer membrane murein-binding lipoprotein Lpp